MIRFPDEASERDNEAGRLRLACLGPPGAWLDGQALSLPTRKALALLIYLAVEGGFQPRPHLMALFWPDSQTERGRSALDAVELTNHAAQLLREHTPDGTRIHHVITAGGGAPNVVPPFAEVYYYVRHAKGDVVRGLYERLVKCARAGELATETALEIRFEGGIREILPITCWPRSRDCFTP